MICYEGYLYSRHRQIGFGVVWGLPVITKSSCSLFDVENEFTPLMAVSCAGLAQRNQRHCVTVFLWELGILKMEQLNNQHTRLSVPPEKTTYISYCEIAIL